MFPIQHKQGSWIQTKNSDTSSHKVCEYSLLPPIYPSLSFTISQLFVIGLKKPPIGKYPCVRKCWQHFVITLLWVTLTEDNSSSNRSRRLTVRVLVLNRWPDLAKFRHFGKIFNAFGNFLRVYLVFGKILDQLCQILYTTGQIFIDVNGQMLQII